MKKALVILSLLLLPVTAYAGDVCFWVKGYFCPLGSYQTDSGTFQLEHYVYCCD